MNALHFKTVSCKASKKIDDSLIAKTKISNLIYFANPLDR